jgi:hypothetical protein
MEFANGSPSTTSPPYARAGEAQSTRREPELLPGLGLEEFGQRIMGSDWPPDVYRSVFIYDYMGTAAERGASRRSGMTRPAGPTPALAQRQRAVANRRKSPLALDTIDA